MSSRVPRIPKYRRHATGQAFVQVRGKRHYLGKYGTDESQERYRRFAAELTASPVPNAITPQDSGVQGATVVELCAAYRRWAEDYYGDASSSLHRVKQAIRCLTKTHAHTRVAEFGPLSLQAIQKGLVDENHSRGYLNHLIQACRRIFKWGVGVEMVPVEIYQSLAVVPGIRRGKAREASPVEAIANSAVEATLTELSSTMATMVRVQRLCGCRPGELLVMRPMDIDRTGDIWEYRPAKHKGDWRGKRRVVFLGPKCQELLTPLFSNPERERRIR